MSEPRKNHLNIDGGQVKEDENISSYKPIPESDTAHEIEYADGVYMQLNQGEIMETEMQDDADDHWEQKSIKLLLNLYLQNVHKFRDPKIRKKSLWVDIGAEVGKGPDCCDKKFRNLKQTYVRLLKKKNRHGGGVVKWPYFEIFEEIFSENGEYNSDIQQRLQDSTSDTVTKALLSLNVPTKFDSEVHENGESSSNQSEEVRRRLSRKRYAEFRKVTLEMRDRQRTVEEKLDRLINIVEESNNIQRERNILFQQFLDKLNQSQA